MAWYKEDRALKRSYSAAFDEESYPGQEAMEAGIYECVGCGREIGIAKDHPLPPQNHHQHTIEDGPYRWRMIVHADHRHGTEQRSLG